MLCRNCPEGKRGGNGKVTMTERVKKLKSQTTEQIPEICVERAQIITKAYEDYGCDPAKLLRAKAFARILKEMTVCIEEEELIVGNLATKPRSAPVFPEFATDFILREMDTFEKRTAGVYSISEENKRILREILPKWRGKTTKERALTIVPEEAKAAMESQLFILTPLSCGIGHIAVDYRKIVDEGVGETIRELRERLAKCSVYEAKDLDKKIFYEACIITLSALVDFAARYAALAEEQAAKLSGQRREELLEIARICRKVPNERAETFQEALQSFWFLHLCLQIESNGHSMSPGRFDQYMIRPYLADLARGVRGEVLQELLECLWIKFAQINKLRDEAGSKAFGGYPMFQNLLVGGQDAEGRDVTNELSLLCCRVTRELKLSQPSLSVRWHKNSSKELMREAAEVARSGIGMPAYFNDEIIVPILQNMGCTLEEARDYCEVGCVEPHVAGKMEGMYPAGFDNLCKVLELALNDGIDPLSGRRIGPSTGLAFNDFEAFYRAYFAQMVHMQQLHAQSINAVEYVHQRICPTPLVSCFVENCIAEGKDIREGGAKYNCTSPNCVGLANVADALLCMKKKVFEEKKYTFEQMREILKQDFAGNERVRLELLNDVPKYGNGDLEADELARRVGEDYCVEFKKFKGSRGGTYQPGLQSISAHALFVGSIGATPDGRTKSMLVSDGGVSPAQGRDIQGPTAEMRSVARLNQFEATNGALLNVKFHPSAVQGERGLQTLCALVDSYFLMGGQHVQFNIVDSKILRDAQKHPENYKDLVVRVAGFSVLFTTLDCVLQNDIIERTEHTHL